MSQEIADKFVAALHKLEETRDVEEISSLYADDAEIVNVVTPHTFKGVDGAREFWTKYRESFGEMRSEFRNHIYGETASAHEWTTTGTANNNNEIVYSGVTILEFADNKIQRSGAYFNSQDLGKQMESGAPAKPNQATAD